MFNNKKVKEELEQQRYSQKDLANYVGIPQSTLSDKINGKTKFTADEAYKVAKFLNKKLEYFYS